ncbi:ferritin-like domain-containing protein [Corallococcus sp. ZKHCc1 1396]|uniref:Ferritin-like domain-containing protein n=1 Tax=Corallococcus soli TaxID=2710757 RepID=A0ABR9PMI2_9BACT|nr:ferritin-like domain-containing protein [Corallococcus soli]MBE4749110.1 ferritin-like domain-containing protein [Corallococcus soli]
MVESQTSPFVTDLQAIRHRVLEHLEEGAFARDAPYTVATTLRLLNDALATEIVCVLRYTHHALSTAGLDSEAVKAEFGQHAREDQEHALRLSERIHTLGGQPDFHPRGISSRDAHPSGADPHPGDRLRESLLAKRIAIETYRDLLRHFANHDRTTRRLLEDILQQEESHAHDMHAALVAHQRRCSRMN